ncbi:MFS transporter [Aspergillus homomorphus CBS 101889]|uniref:MFS amine transporter n=1 Tax=Aspergillus homomorphus (strain CBS 101889) TaxID=1450537 RepID=A0A395I9S5_ASPHC|nr:MFS amine transporter [Aspergillus homomorphus CBS 101889]RAL14894.1 MFS amine transporter [Aspergillus homomorphus CBS 101889]
MLATHHNHPAPWKLAFRSSKTFVTWVVAIACFTDVFIYGMIVPILPIVLKTRVSVPEEDLQQWMSIMLAAFGGGIFFGSRESATLKPTAIFGYFADRSSSRQLPFMIGLLALGGTTVVFWFARTVASLVIARALQGLSAAVVWTVGMALVVDTVGKDQVGAAMGYVSMALTVGTVFGPFIGGIMLSRVGYHSVFLLAIALIVVDISLRLVMVEQKTAAKWLPIKTEESSGLLDSPAGAGCVGYSTLGDQDSASSLCPPDDVLIESPGKERGEPDSSGKATSVPGIVRLICSGKLMVVLVATVVDAILYSSFDTVLPLYVMKTFDWGPMGIGLCFLPLFAPSFASPWIGDAVDRLGALQIAFIGFLLDCPTFLLFQLVTENTIQHQALLVVFLLLAGAASTLQMVSLMVEVGRVTERYEREYPGIFGHQGGTAQAYGLFNVAWSGGQVLGPLMAGLLVDQAGWATMVSTFGVMSGGIAVMIALSDRKVRGGLWEETRG